MRKLLPVILLSVCVSNCEVLSKLPTGVGFTEAEAEAGEGEGIKEALGQGLVKAPCYLWLLPAAAQLIP